jgi:DNA-binding GntR family transcriptional regulator
MSADAPAYRRIADDLRQRIRSGDLAPGDLLPTQVDLAEQYGVARMTARQALAELANEGLIFAQQGKGTIVRERRPVVYRPQAEYFPRTTRQLDRFLATLQRQGRQSSQSIEVAVESADPFVAQRWEIEPGQSVAVRKRVRYVDDEPFNINDTYYRYDLAADTAIMNPADIPSGSNNVLDAKGYAEVRAVDEIYVRMPSQEEVRRLHLQPGTPVAVHVVTGYTANDEPCRVDVFVLPGDRHVIVYERIRPTTADDTSYIEDEYNDRLLYNPHGDPPVRGGADG